MLSNINWDQFEPVEENLPEVEEEVQNLPQDSKSQSNDIDWNSFEPVEESTEETPKKRKLKDLSWMERTFTQEGHDLEAEANRNTGKAILSGITAGYSQYLHPSLKVDEEIENSTGGEIVGSFLPLGLATKVISIPLKAAANLSTKYVKPLTALGDLLGLSLVGGTYNALEESAEKSIEQGEFVPPSPETILEQGAKWAALDIALNTLGFTGRFAKGLYDKSIEVGKPVMEVLENTLSETFQKFKGGDKVAEKALSVLENKPLQEIEREVSLINKNKEVNKAEQVALEKLNVSPEQRTTELKQKKIDPKAWNKLEESMQVNVQPYLPLEFEANKIAEEAIDEGLSARIDSVSQRSPNERKLGQSIQEDIESQLNISKVETDQFYDIAKEVEETVLPKLQKTATSIVEKIKQLQKGNLKLSPQGYKKAEEDLFNMLEDLGYHPVIDEVGNLSSAVLQKKIPLSQAIEVKKRLNKIINYDLLESSAQDVLQNPTASLRQDIREAYGSNTRQRQAFEEAEKKYAEHAQKKGKKSITKIRHSETPEAISKIIKTPSGLADIKDVVSKEQFSQIERELLEHIKGLNEQKAEAFYREVRPSLSSDTRSIAEELIQSKAPKNSPTRRESLRNKIQETIYDDLSKATLTGERPEKVLNLWKTKEGQQLIKNSLKDNPNQKEILKYLSDQSLEDFASSVVDVNGDVSFKKIKEMIKDPATAANIRMVAGDEGLAFLNNIETLSKRVDKNSSILERTIGKSTANERAKIQKEVEKLGEQRLQRTKENNLSPSKTEKVAEEKLGKKAVKERNETNDSLEKRGKDRFKKSKEKREFMNAEQKAAFDAAEKKKIGYMVDDFIKTYGQTTKGLMAGLGIWNFGVLETAAGAATFEALSFLIRNKRAQQAFKKAAGPWQNSLYFLRSVDELEKELEKSE